MNPEETIEVLSALWIIMPSHHPDAPYAISPAFDLIWERHMRENLPQTLDFAKREEIGTIGAILQLIIDSIKEYSSNNHKTIENTDLLCDLALTLLDLAPDLACV